MYYLFLAFPLIIYCEFLGRLFFFYIKKKQIEFNFIIGFCLLVAFLYVTGWPISVYGLASIYYVILVCAFILISLVLIIKNIKKIDLHFNYKLWLIFVLFLIIAIIISYNRTLGECHGYDVLFYVNLVGNNVSTPMLNGIHREFGGLPSLANAQGFSYAFQSYYYFASTFIYITRTIFSIINITIESLPAFVWTFQIMLSAFYIGSSIEIIKSFNSKNKLLNVSIFALLVLFMGNFYYNNCYGFFGNSYRMPIHSMSTLFLINYFKNEDKKDLFIFFLLMLSLCGFSSSGTFAYIFICFALFFVLINEEKNMLKYYSLFLFFPTLNILLANGKFSPIVFLFLIIFFVVIYILNNFIVSHFQNKKVRIFTVMIVSIVLAFISIIFYSKNISIVDAFFTNHSEIMDMSWDYFSFKNLKHYIFNLLMLIPMLCFIIKHRNNKLSMIIWILILTIFNPLSSNFINYVIKVYYRSYDLIINQYTIALFLYSIYNDIKFKKILTTLILCLTIVLCVLQVPSYEHYLFKPDKNYNPIYKIEQDELDLIWNLRNMIKEYDIKEPKIINPTFYMNTFIENSSYMLGREKRPCTYKDKNIFELYKIVFPEGEYDNFKPDSKPDYDNLTTYLENVDFNIFVVDYEKYFDYKGKYMSLSQALESEGYIKEDKYSTLKYAVFYLN